ncbi:aspartate carbamoyltransferase regulatory subunit [Keratinibaculum paraultunense]|uniref:Aspartate carbamoyltransferase regulatory subunit n=1 Tax=Keratinibaculum paraultunense TaxID=1278232 RepID=A0A4R3KY06_9FIRM|nr:aspartate carbamoyltransferase regulatory subunit [Keratinibaculum paraultunense]QQY80328.1 aspartate carbamoyltransferase regulatory subunit [Keratinibaculum paraultunense]TCS90850.1 aspartate carbamoyltransferase regulatory subunit [Keratinibaculum paraultunense]
MLYIDSIVRGIVIDHIKPGYGFSIFKYLGLDKADFTVALIMNAPSKKYGRKDLIKIENNIDLDLTMLGFIDPNITVNIIEDEKIVEKINLSLPEKVEGIIKCKNPRCVTSTERNIVHRFVLVDEEKGIYKCEYCDQIYSWEG